MTPVNPPPPSQPPPVPSTTSRLLEDADAPNDFGSAPTLAPVAVAPSPRAASPLDPGGDLSDGFVQLKLSPEGTQTTPDRRNAGTTRGPNATVPLRRLSLLRNSTEEEVMQAVAKFVGLPITEFSDCAVFYDENKMHAITVVRATFGTDDVIPPKEDRTAPRDRRE